MMPKRVLISMFHTILTYADFCDLFIFVFFLSKYKALKPYNLVPNFKKLIKYRQLCTQSPMF